MKKILLLLSIMLWASLGYSQNVFPTNGNVGIGTTSPTSPLHLIGNMTLQGLSTSNYIPSLFFKRYSDAAPMFSLGYKNPFTPNSNIDFNSLNGNPITFSMVNVERMSILDNGNVGIGITTPAQKLEIGGGRPIAFNSSLGAIKMKGDTGGWAMNYGFLGNNGTDLGGLWGYGGADAITQWSIGKDYTDNFFVVKSSGNIGVGTVNPTEKLSIYGVNNSAPGIMSFESSREDVQNAEVGLLKAKNSGVEIARVGLNRAGGSYTGFLNFWVKKTNETALFEAMRISENGNVGIGINEPTTKLHINGGLRISDFFAMGNNQFQWFKDANGNERRLLGLSAANIVHFGDVDNTIVGSMNLFQANSQQRFFTNGTEKFTIIQNGNIGIGTTTPTAKLEIASLSGSGLKLTGLSQTNVQGSTIRTLGVNGNGEVVTLDGSLAIQTDFTQNIKFINDISANKTAKMISGNANGGAIRFGANGTKAENRNLDLGQMDNNGDFYSYMTVKSETGNIGIGTTTPNEKITLENGNLQIQKGNGGSGSFGKIQWQNSLAYSNSARAFIEARRGGNDDGNLDFATANTTNATPLIRMTINNDGNVGIGTITPTRKFEVLSPTNDIAYFRDNSTASEVNFRGNATQTIFDFGNRPLQVQFNSVPSFTLNTSGNMGIGITSPAQKLHINGNSMLSGANPKQFYDWSGIAAFSTGIFGNTTNDTRFSIYTNSAGEAFSVNYYNGNVNIGATNMPAGYKLAIGGDVIAERVVVKLQSNWPDYVFSPNYKRTTLSEIGEFINKNHHLPNVPSAQEVAKNGIDIGQMNSKLLEKIEEMTLYMIEQQKELKSLKEEVKLIKEKK